MASRAIIKSHKSNLGTQIFSKPLSTTWTRMLESKLRLTSLKLMSIKTITWYLEDSKRCLTNLSLRLSRISRTSYWLRWKCCNIKLRLIISAESSCHGTLRHAFCHKTLKSTNKQSRASRVISYLRSWLKRIHWMNSIGKRLRGKVHRTFNRWRVIRRSSSRKRERTKKCPVSSTSEDSNKPTMTRLMLWGLSPLWLRINLR